MPGPCPNELFGRDAEPGKQGARRAQFGRVGVGDAVHADAQPANDEWKPDTIASSAGIV